MPGKGKEQRGAGGEQVGTPRYPETTPPPLPSGDYSYVLEIVMNMQHAMGKLTEAVDRLKEDQTKHDKKLDRISHQIYAAIAVLTLILGVFWYFASTINSYVIRQLPAPAQQQQPSK